ncbi:MAG: exodeoxyribonuclease V subunit gamma [Chlamydiales bacterium]
MRKLKVSIQDREVYREPTRFNQGVLFFSNYLEILFEQLKENLFSSDSTPFAQRLIMVPHRSMEQWIQFKLAQDLDLKIACGIITTSLSRGVEMLSSSSFSQLELILVIEHELREILNLSDPIWQPLVHYLKGKEHRSMGLAGQLARLFARYGVYGKQECARWGKMPRNWQEALWQRVALKWDYPIRLLQKEKSKKLSDFAIHLFSFSHIPSLYFHFFQKVMEETPLFFYQLSPCQEFWSDLPSKREGGYLPEQFAQEGHPLLRNLGKVGQQTASLIEESDLITHELYLKPRGKTQLERLQSDLLTLEERKEEIIEDDSIQVHIVSTPHQEVKVLYSNLLSLFQERGWEPKDVLVMAPDISVYVPYIKSIFGDSIDFQVVALPMHKYHLPLQGLFLLLDLEKRRWAAPAVLELFHHPLFLKKQKWREEDLFQIQEWIQSTGIRWAVNLAHRNELLKKSHCQKEVVDSKTTWQSGIDSLLEELALSVEKKRIDFTQAELLGDLAQLLYTLLDCLAPLYNQTEKTLKQWGDYLKELYSTYFSFSEDREKLFNLLDRIAIGEKKYSFQMVDLLLKESLGQERFTLHPNRLQAVQFGSLHSMNLIPAKAICLLGMNHDAFPRKQRFVSLDLLKSSGNGDYYPTQAESDRYLFLEALLSAREKFIISYQGFNAMDLTEEPPSTVVSELFPYFSSRRRVAHSQQTYTPKSAPPPSPLFPKTVQNRLPEGEVTIEMQDLVQAVRAPLKHYLYHRGNLWFQEEQSISPEDTLTLSPLQRAILRKTSLKKPLSQALKNAPHFPSGIFGQLAQLQLQKEQNDLNDPDRWQTIELSDCPQEPTAERIWCLPALHFPLSNTLKVKIVGKIEGVGPEGVSVLEMGDFRGAIKAWPIFLVLNALENLPSSLKVDTLFFARSGDIKKRFFESHESHLSSLLSYFFWSQETPSPLFPDWVEAILKKDPIKLEKQITQPSFDHTLKWALRKKIPLSPLSLIETFSPWAAQLYKGMADAWF